MKINNPRGSGPDVETDELKLLSVRQLDKKKTENVFFLLPSFCCPTGQLPQV